MKCTIFYSWQSDLPNKTNRNYIETCIKQAIKEININIELQLDIIFDRDTVDITGTPDITGAIFSKIEKTDLFVCDISIINYLTENRKTPNPNVLIELGYAAKSLGWEKVICLFNSQYGCIDDLPFDLRQKRITIYNPSNQNDKKRISDIICNTVKGLYVKGMLFNPLKDHVKGQIDCCFLEIVKNFNCILFGTISMSDALSKVNEFLSLEENDLNEKVDTRNVFMGFFAYNDFSVTKAKLENLLNIILTSSKFEDFWAVAVIELLDWLRLYVFLLDGREGKLYEVSPLPNKKFDIVPSNSLNTRNPENSYILLKRASGKGQVVNLSCLRTLNKSYMLSPHFIRNDIKESYINCVIRLIKICTNWLKATGSEFILDPEYYYIT